MRIDWVPYSASALVVGAAALSVGAIVVPQAGIPSSPLWIVEEQPASWLVVSGLYLIASVSLILGLPAVLSIFDLRAARALSTGDLFTVGLQDLASDPGLSVILYGWVLTFALGELLLALALVQAQRVQRWVPWLLVLHVGLSPLAPLLPDPVAVAVALLVTIAFAALGIVANQRALLP